MLRPGMNGERSPETDAVAPRVVVRRAVPTPPADRGSASLYLAEAERQGVAADRKMLYVGTETATGHIAGVLGIEADAEVIARRKLLLADDIPVRVATSFFRADLFAGTRLAEPGFVQPSLQAAIRELGYVFGHAEEELVARPASAVEAETLDLESGEWVVQILRTSVSDQGTPVHALETICAATRHVFSIGQAAGQDEF